MSTVAPSTHHPLLPRLAERPRAVAETLALGFAEAGREFYFVGGIVRDLLLGHPLPADLDFATSASPEETMRLGKAAGADAVYDVGARFGTVAFVFGDADRVQAEITTFRQEVYPDDTRFPSVRLGVDLEEDLSRRDFTANAIAVAASSGELIDPFGGQADIARGLLRAVGDADERFAEDPLRLLRAARFVAQLGFRIDPETERAMARQASSLARISQERIFAELGKLLLGDYADHGLDALLGTGIFLIALPELAPLAAEVEQGRGRVFREKDLWEHTKLVVRQTPPRPALRWTALLHDAAKPLCRAVDATGEVNFIGHESRGADLATKLLRRLKADKALQVAVRRLVELHGRPATYDDQTWTDSAVRRLALDAGAQWPDLLDFAAADVTSGREAKRRLAADRVAALRAHFDRLQAEADLAKLQSPLDGDELMALFAREPGIWIKHVKDRLRELVIDGELAIDDKATAAAIAREILRGNETPS